MAWTGQTFTVGQILTAAQMNNLQGDISALAAGDTGSPDIAGCSRLANGSFSNVANHDITSVFDSTIYYDYFIVFDYWYPNTNARDLAFRISSDNGSSFVSAANYKTEAGTARSEARIDDTALFTNSITSALRGTLHILNPVEANTYFGAIGTFQYNAGLSHRKSYQYGASAGTSWNAISLRGVSTNVTGAYSIWGRRKDAL